ncbi:MAG: MerR family transcriptional regulator [bacterium]|nr:MerR family transcriptional regulator [bacterium]
MMSYTTKLKIGAFSQMMQVTVKTLRHYEQKGILLPHEVDEFTGYRYYTLEQMQRLNNIRFLQRLGFSLDEIRSTKLRNCLTTIRTTPTWTG